MKYSQIPPIKLLLISIDYIRPSGKENVGMPAVELGFQILNLVYMSSPKLNRISLDQ